ncbi:MAG: glutamine synthetase III [Victivallaceae bacterium]|nr:glutamine synthetase III [Victivallaceae bacterium]MDD4317165.1 glutamine synthetase III [Victivallaceae bacterium]
MNISCRSKTMDTIAARHADCPLKGVSGNIDFYAEDVFNTESIKQYLPSKVAAKLLATINDGKPLNETIASDVAHGMKEWAIDHGATHFTHWFLPLTGSTAEKHDSFLEPVGDKAIMTFSGKNLIVGEPDASSFPSGGLRCTFEARGYTAWDPTSPAFIKRHANGATLCIPTAFCSYTGAALDKKTPVLRSIQALSTATKRLMKAFNQPTGKVTVMLGAEQEYFLIDRLYYLHRPDLVQTGRTLFGAPPPKHQQLEDHYFGSIRQRVLKFMTEVEHELWRLGIPAKTRHNEVAPAQFELAPVFEEVNLAIDHNMLVMEILRQVAERHGLVCLLHEKPFAGVNGSGKHNNWSLLCGKVNLLDPGNDPEQNAIFLTALCAMIQAVDKHSDLLLAAVAGAGNDHRLGANEAPPGIISIYLGQQLNEIIELLENGNGGSSHHKASQLRIGVDVLPPLPRDATDRNRTSPFAFTGNKFEFRAPGSSHSCAGAMMVLNTIAAEALDEIAAEIEKFKPKTFNAELQTLLKSIIKKHKRIIFNGDNYSGEWRKEAAARGLFSSPSALEWLKSLTDRKNIDLFEKYKVFTEQEISSRHEVFVEEYRRRIRIEGGIALEICNSMIVPAVVEQFQKVTSALLNAKTLKMTGTSGLTELAKNLGCGIDELGVKAGKLEKALKNNRPEDIVKAMNELRKIADGMENLVADDAWPLPKYREMLFIY